MLPRRGCFSLTPRWTATATAGIGLRGDRLMSHSLVGDHAALLPAVTVVLQWLLLFGHIVFYGYFCLMSKVRALYHIVFGTHKRVASITDEFRKDLYMVILGIIKDYKVQGQVSRLIRIGGVEDHVHLLIDLHSMMALAPLVGEIKRRSSLWMKERRDRYPLFDGWSREYYAATLAEKDSGTVIEYINNQQEHHHGAEDYEEELKRLVEDAGLTWHPDMIED